MDWAIYRRGVCVGMQWALGLAMLLCAARNVFAVTVRLDDRDLSSTVLLHVGDRLRVELPAAPATAFRWKAKALDASHLELMSRDTRLDSSRLDASGTQVFVWKAIAPGSADIGIEYSRPNDDKTMPPAKRMSIAVEVAGGELASTPGDGMGEGLARTATYQGTLPCDGCTGIAIELTLFGPGGGVPDKPDGRIFVERRRYQGAPGGDRTIAGTGKLVTVRGTYADPTMTVISLAAPDGSLENFKLDGDWLVPLDGQMLPVPPAPGSAPDLGKGLKKIPGDAESGASGP